MKFTFPLAVDPYIRSFHTIILHFAGQFKVHTQANIYLYTAVSDGYLKRIVGFKCIHKPRVVIIGAHKLPAECCGLIKSFVLYLIL